MAQALLTGGGDSAPLDEITATASDILSGKKSVNSDGDLITGTISSRGAPTASLYAGQSYSILSGYYSGGNISAKSLSEQTPGNAKSKEILSGKEAWVNGSKVIGVMSNRGHAYTTINAGETYRIQEGYHDGNGTVTAKSLSNQTSATAVVSDILSGKTAWVNGTKITGTMVNREAVTKSLDAGASYTIPAGYHNGNGKVTANSLASQTSGNALPEDLISGKTAWVGGRKIVGTIVNRGGIVTSMGFTDVGLKLGVEIPTGYYSTGLTTGRAVVTLETEEKTVNITHKTTEVNTLENGKITTKVTINSNVYNNFKEVMPSYDMPADDAFSTLSESDFMNKRHDSFSIQVPNNLGDANRWNISAFVLGLSKGTWTYNASDKATNKRDIIYVPTGLDIPYGSYSDSIGPYAANITIGSNKFAVSFRRDSFGNAQFYFDFVNFSTIRSIGNGQPYYVYLLCYVNKMKD